MKLLLSLISTLLCLLFAEGAIRLAIDDDKELGNEYFKGRQLRPFRPCVPRIKRILEKYSRSDSSAVMYSPLLGWTNRPNGRSEDGLYEYNSAGIRSPEEYEKSPTPGTFRIVLLGDSYTHGNNVKLKDSWGHRLEEMLKEGGVNAEVLNFGVGGYGIDQAYLRWIHEARAFSPHLVILGFFAHDMMRNLNLFRSIFKPYTGMPFSKPRFVLTSSGLELINSPTVPVGDIVDTLDNFERWPLARYELYFDENYERRWWLRSRLISVLLSFGKSAEYGERRHLDNPDIYSPSGESGRLTLAIVDALAKDVDSRGAGFLIVSLPARRELNRMRKRKPLLHRDILKALDKRYAVAATSSPFNLKKLKSYFRGHYNARGCKRIAKQATQGVLRWLEEHPEHSI